MGWNYGLKAFTATILGGIGNIPAAMLGGLLLGTVEIDVYKRQKTWRDLSLIVQKYGGSSVATVEKIKRVAEKIKRVIQEGEKVCVVVSAMGKTTDGLISLAKKISGTPEPRELDMLLSTGEQVTAALLSIALNELGIPSVSLNALQLEMITTPDFNNARIIDINTEKLMEEFKTNDVVVVTGFQGITDFKDVTTLGRGGSDTSAVAIAAKLNARCEIYSDVPGIFACDPRAVSYTHLTLQGKTEEARRLHLQLFPLMKGLFCETNPIPVKYAASKLGLCRNELRLPLIPASPKAMAEVDGAMEEGGILSCVMV